MADPLEEKFGPLVDETPSAFPDPSYVLQGKYATLEYLREDHFPSLWTNLDLTGAGSSNEDYLPGPRTFNVEKLKDDLYGIMQEGITTFAIRVDPSYLGPGKGTGKKVPPPSPPGENDGKRTSVSGVIFYDATKASNREVEIGMILAKTLHRTYAATEAHYLWLRNVCEANSPGLNSDPPRTSLPYRKVHWKCNHLNVFSKRCAERIGYKLEGTLRKNMIAKGRSRDTDLYGFVDDEWPAIKEALEVWLDEGNFDEEGVQRRRLAEIREGLVSAGK